MITYDRSLAIIDPVSPKSADPYVACVGATGRAWLTNVSRPGQGQLDGPAQSSGDRARGGDVLTGSGFGTGGHFAVSRRVDHGRRPVPAGPPEPDRPLLVRH